MDRCGVSPASNAAVLDRSISILSYGGPNACGSKKKSLAEIVVGLES